MSYWLKFYSPTICTILIQALQARIPKRTRYTRSLSCEGAMATLSHGTRLVEGALHGDAAAMHLAKRPAVFLGLFARPIH
jgi:hypothetical protein